MLLGSGKVRGGAAAADKSIDLERGSSQYARIANDLGITSGTCTLEAWIKLESVPNAADYAVCEVADAGTGVSFTLLLTDVSGVAANTNLRVYRIRHGIAAVAADYVIGSIAGTWVHFVGVFNTADSTIKLYTALAGGVHTERASTATSGTGNVDNTYDGFNIGSGDPDDNTTFTATNFFDGLVDDVRVWNTARTITQMDDNDELELVGNEAGLIAYYRLNGAVTDLTANAYNLTATGSPVYSTDGAF